MGFSAVLHLLDKPAGQNEVSSTYIQFKIIFYRIDLEINIYFMLLAGAQVTVTWLYTSTTVVFNNSLKHLFFF